MGSGLEAEDGARGFQLEFGQHWALPQFPARRNCDKDTGPPPWKEKWGQMHRLLEVTADCCCAQKHICHQRARLTSVLLWSVIQRTMANAMQSAFSVGPNEDDKDIVDPNGKKPQGAFSYSSGGRNGLADALINTLSRKEPSRHSSMPLKGLEEWDVGT